MKGIVNSLDPFWHEITIYMKVNLRGKNAGSEKKLHVLSGLLSCLLHVHNTPYFFIKANVVVYLFFFFFFFFFFST